ncbi:MAG: hypothetical protein ACLFRJ_10595 [Ectothiorhodospira sp.]
MTKPADLEQEIARLYGEGMAITMIATKLSVPPRRVRRVLRALGIPSAQRTDPVEIRRRAGGYEWRCAGIAGWSREQDPDRMRRRIERSYSHLCAGRG